MPKMPNKKRWAPSQKMSIFAAPRALDAPARGADTAAQVLADLRGDLHAI